MKNNEIYQDNDYKKQKENADKLLLKAEYLIGYVATIFLFAIIFVVSYVPMADWLIAILILLSLTQTIISFCFCLKIEQVAGYYECEHCNHKYVPTYKKISLSPHYGRTRYMKCPNCGEKSWQKKVINKD